jgi:hypothetical protein
MSPGDRKPRHLHVRSRAACRFEVWASRSMRSAVLGLGTFVLATRACAPAVADETQRKRFLDEAPKAWAALNEYIARSHSVIRTTATIHTRDAANGTTSEQVMHWSTEVKRADGRMLFVNRNAADYPDPGPRETATGQNPDYDFSLARELEDRPWMVKKFHPASASSADRANTRAANVSMDATSLYGIGLSDAIGEPAFELLDARLVPDAAGERVEIEFRYTPSGDNRSRLRGGTARFAPDR